MTAQLGLKARCRRCGRELLEDAELGRELEGALAEIEAAKMRWPCGVAAALRKVANVIWCRLGTCEGTGV